METSKSEISEAENVEMSKNETSEAGTVETSNSETSEAETIWTSNSVTSESETVETSNREISEAETVEENEKSRNYHLEEFEYVKLESFSISENIECVESDPTVESEEEEQCFNLEKSVQNKIKKQCELKLLDTLKCKDFLNKKVEMLTFDDKLHVGVLKYLDPMSGDMIIVNAEDEQEKTLIFPATCVSVTLLDESDSSSGIRKVLPYLTVKKHKNRLIGWLKDHDILVQSIKDSCGRLLISGRVKIDPPYRPEDCSCDNPMLLERVQKIVKDLTLKSQF